MITPARPKVLPSIPRLAVAVGLLALLVLVLVLVLVVLRQPANAAAPLDHRSTAPNQSAELPGAGYLLTDPLQGPSRAYWAGAYRTIAGARAYCVHDFYDYPNAAYGYRAPEVSHWAGRPGSNNGAQGHTAQRIIWIINSYGQSTAPGTDAAVSMAINLLTGSAPFQHSYASYFRPQLAGINPAILTLIHRLIADSDRYAGPDRTRVSFGPNPPLGGTGSFTVQVRSARDIVLPNAPFRVIATAGLTLRSAGYGRTGPTGTATVRYTAAKAGPVAAIAQGTQVPNTTMRLGYSPGHDAGSFRTGSQRLALVSAHRFSVVPPGAGRGLVRPPSIRTVVQAGTGPRPVGAPVTDLVQASGLVPRSAYRLQASLQDGTGTGCGSVTLPVRADDEGRLDVVTPALASCGGGSDTFSEQLLDAGGHTVLVSVAGQPSETFPITPTVTTAVVGGLMARPFGAPVADQVSAIGLLPGGVYRVGASLRAASGQVCGSVAATARSDAHGRLELRTAALPVCGRGKNTFTEQLSDSSGVLRASTAPWRPAETFPVRPPTAAVPPVSASKPPVGSSRPPVVPVRRSVVTPMPRLASTGSAPGLALIGGLLGIAVGGLLLLAGRCSQ